MQALFLGIELTDLRQVSVGVFVLSVMCPRLSLLTRQLGNFLLDSSRQIFNTALLHRVGCVFPDVPKLKYNGFRQPQVQTFQDIGASRITALYLSCKIPPPGPSPATPPAAALPAAPCGHRRQLPAGRSRTRRCFCVRRPAVCAWRLASPAAVARSLPGAPKKHRKQVITGGECASRRGTAYF